MNKIFKFKTQEQLDKFDLIYNYSGVLSTEGSVWIYGEGTPKWFSIQYCGDRWVMNHKVGSKWENVNFYPVNYDELTAFINERINTVKSKES
ncbi:hypothetical protein [Maribellus mangrovi]|uniref:hypothetical protein n=1 Tax=Maribellus mangrovi TaxID=3133146 RepID=UPI0030ED3CEC